MARQANIYINFKIHNIIIHHIKQERAPAQIEIITKFETL